jgi:hypothetical protein
MRWIRSVGVFISFCGVPAGMFLIQSTVVKLIFTFRSYHFTDVQTVLKAVESMAFNFGKQLSDIRADVRVESLIVKPSEACKSNPENIAVFSRLLECLHLEYNHDLSLAAVEGECCADCPWANHVHNWAAARNAAKLPADADKPDTSLEASSYEPLVEYLKSVAHQNALAVRNGAGLPNGLLFDMFVYSLKSDVRLRSKVLRMTADEPRAKFHIMGRTDVVVLHPSSVSATRQTTCFAPPPADFKITGATGVPGSSPPLRDLVHDDYAVDEVEGLELNGAWAARFSKTIKRMKQKAHKAKRKASWLPKR